ncbi:hypothetical protein GCM10023318_05780 [Nocardia callitridis]|uniref:Carrier domain-containing protein n=1 Tax=Nocardia callitridis TaxID=648753 RepID=A0ABP9JSY0_9NOCA
MLERHEALRTWYPATDGTGYQEIVPVDRDRADTVPVPLAEGELADWLDAVVRPGFELTRAVPVRLALAELAPDDHVLALVVHRIAADQSSLPPLVRDLLRALLSRRNGATRGLPTPSSHFADYVLWQRDALGEAADQESVAATQLRYWRAQLADLPDLVELPTDRPRPAVASLRAATFDLEIAASTHARLTEIARAHDTSVFTVLHTAYAVLLARLSGSGDIAVGTQVSGRGVRGEHRLDDMVGVFVNTVVLRTRMAEGETFTSVLSRQREIDPRAFANADLPFESLVAALEPTRSTARHPLFQAGFGRRDRTDIAVELPGLSVRRMAAENKSCAWDLHLSVAENHDGAAEPAGIDAVFTYATDLFDPATARGFAERFERILAAISADADAVVGDIDILTPAERSSVLTTWNDTAHIVDPHATLATLLRRAVAEEPDAVALVQDPPEGERRRELTYRELGKQVNHLARHLISMGVGPGSLVALALHRSVELIVASYAVVEAGGAYVPVDPAQAVERTQHILSTAAPACVLTDATAGFDTDIAPVIRLDELTAPDRASGAPIEDGERVSPLRPENTAYVIFTSGSTGSPKGVAVPHAAIVNQLLWKAAQFALSSDEVMLLKTAATFDLSVWESWSAVACAGRLVLAAPEGHRDPSYLNDLLVRESVTTLHVVPSMVDALLVHSVAAHSALRRVLAIGATLPAAVARRFAAAYPEVALYNLYGPAEAAVSVTSHRVTEADEASVPIGIPEWNSGVYVLDGRLRPVPVGVAGELYLTGAQLARGYVGRGDLTAERFVADPFQRGARMYRTGDLGAWHHSGELGYRGRADAQLKIRGFRIEPGEIEAAMLALPGVAQAAVIAQADPNSGERLVGYLVAADAVIGVGAARVKSALSARLPSYMVPSTFVVLDALPLNVHGKVDRKALPEPEFEVPVFRAPSTPVEEIVASAFARVLGVERVGADDDFFVLGGNSLLALEAADRIGKALDAPVPVRTLFETATVTGLAVGVEHLDRDPVPLAAVRRQEPLPLSYAQRRMWFRNRYDNTTSVYHTPAAIRLSGVLDVAALRRAVADLVARHEILRTSYPETPDGPVQRILPPHLVPIELVPAQIGEERVGHDVRGVVAAAFDVEADVPLRAQLFQLAGSEYVLVLVAHRISVDAWSIGPLTRDLMLAYAARSGGETPSWSPLPIQYADYTMWQRELLGSEDDPRSLSHSQLDYWCGQLAGVPDELSLPADRPRPRQPSYAGAATEFVIDPAVHAALLALAERHNATLFMVVHTAFAVFLARMSGTEDIAIGTPVAGRGRAELDDLIGLFANTLVLRTKVSPELGFAELLAANRETDLRAFANADLPFERLVEVLDPPRSPARHPLFQVVLSFENHPVTSLDLPGLSFAALDPAADTAEFDLRLTVREQRTETGDPAGLAAEFSYARDLFDEETVVEFGRRLRRLLTEVAREAATSSIARAVGELDILDDSEHADLIARTGAEPNAAQTLGELMTSAAAGNPTATALIADDRVFGYRELDAASAQLARALIARGAGPEAPVVLAIGRSVEFVLALWAVARTGAPVVAIDPADPDRYLAGILDDCGARLGVTLVAERPELPVREGISWIVLDDPDFTVDVAARSDRPLAATELSGLTHPDQLAYLGYGSDDEGVALTHAAVANLCAELARRYSIDTPSRVAALAAPSSPVWLLEVLLALGSAGALVLGPPEGQGAQSMSAAAGTHMFRTSSASAVPVAGAYPTVIGVGCETAPDEAVLAGASETRDVFHGYGRLEATLLATVGEPLRPGERVTVGGPLRGLRALVLDRRLRPVPEGVAGELYLGGRPLARGYHRRPGHTAARFVADPYHPGERLYRTGDVVRWSRALDDPALEYLGRNDARFYVDGLRVDPVRVDAALRAEPEVAAALTVGWTAKRGTVPVSYVSLAEHATVDASTLTGRLRAALPQHLVPAEIIVLERIPVTETGELDPRALPEPTEPGTQDTTESAARVLAEQVITTAISELLGLDEVASDDDFFAIGGESIGAVLLATRVSERGVTLTPRDIFAHPTAARLARASVVEGDTDDESGELPLTPKAARGLDTDLEVRAIALDIPQSCPAETVRSAVATVLEQHPMLWVVLDRTSDPVLRIPAAADRTGEAFRRLDPARGETMLPIDDVVRAAAAALDPEQGRNIHFVLTGGPQGRETLIVVANGLVVDDISWRTIVDQLTVAWSRGRHAAPAGPESGLGALIRTLAAKAEEPATRAEMIWWERTLGAVPEGILAEKRDLRARSRVSLTITAEGAAAVAEAAAAYHTGVDDVLLTACALASQTSGGEIVTRAIGSVIRLTADGRKATDAEESMVGGFSTEYPLPLRLTRIDLEDALVGGPAAGIAIAQIKELRRAVPSHGVGYGLLRHLNPDTAARLRDLGRGRFALRYRDVRPARVHTDTPSDDLLLDLTVDATDDGLLVRFDYAAVAFTADAVKTYAEHWIRALGGLAEHGLRSDVGGFTPSDFPLVRLKQPDIDRFGKRYPDLSDIWPVTPQQSGMLFHALLAESSVDVYTTQFTLELSGAVDQDRMRAAAQAVLDRHDNLRVAFTEDAEGNPVQVVQDSVEVPWRVLELDQLAPEAATAELARIQSADLSTHFDMRTAPLLRLALVRTGPETCHLVTTSHHILLDSWSMPLLLKDLLTAYAVGGATRHLPKVAPYHDYLAWLNTRDTEAARHAWAEALSGITEPTTLRPTDRAREISAGVGEVGFELSTADTTALTRLASGLGVSVHTVVQAAWGLLIGRGIDRDDVVFGATVSGRPAQLDQVQAMVGLFRNAIPVRVRLGATETLGGLLRQLQAEQEALLEHHYLGLADIQDTIGVAGLFDSLVVFESLPVDREGFGADNAVDGMTVTGIEAAHTTHYPLTVLVVLDSQLRVSVQYLGEVYDEAAAQALAQRLSAIIDRFVATPQATVAQIDVLLDSERAALAAGHAPEEPEDDEATLLSLFDAQVARTPTQPAIRHGGLTLTYSQLDMRSRALAAELTRWGVESESLVAVVMRGGIEAFVAIYGVLRAGAAYLPLDPDDPLEHIESVLVAADPVCALTLSDDRFDTDVDVPVVAVDTLFLAPGATGAPTGVRPDNVAFVGYGGVGTGARGTMVTHRQLVGRLRWAARAYEYDADDVVLLGNSISAPAAPMELFLPLHTGARVVVATTGGGEDDSVRGAVENSVTTVHFVPSALTDFLDRAVADDPEDSATVASTYPALRRVFVAGEPVTAALATMCADMLPDAELINWYMTAETSVATAYSVPATNATREPPVVAGSTHAPIPIGAAAGGVRVHVLDRQLRPVPLGAEGELYVESAQLARGYLLGAADTARRFVAHHGGVRLYRTGEIVRWHDAGTLEHRGRADAMATLRGQRLELADIESALLSHESVRRAAAAVLPGAVGQRLIGYVVTEPGAEFDEHLLLRHARAVRTAEPYSSAAPVPSAIVRLDALPRTAHGSLDRAALPAPRLATRPYRAPTTPVERAVTDVFAEVLGIGLGADTTRVSMDDDFFDLGGNSLIATRAVRRLRTLTGARVRVRWLFTDATPSALSARIVTALADHCDYDLDSNAALEVLLPIRTRVPRDTAAAEPLFCLHPMYGLSWCYAGLVRYVPSARPIYGLQSPAMTDDGYLPESLDEMARRYVEEIMAVQPEGPYRLLGWSLGGVLAHAVATELQSAGQQVAPLVLLGANPEVDVTDFRSVVRAGLAELGIGVDTLLPGDGDVHELSEAALVELHATIPPDMAVLTQDRVRRMYHSTVHCAELAARHRPRVFHGRLDYFSAEGDESGARRWRSFVDGIVDDHPIGVPGGQLLAESALARIGPALSALWENAARESVSGRVGHDQIDAGRA